MTYREAMLRTAGMMDNKSAITNLTHGALGLGGEAGEVIDLIKKCAFHNKPLDRDKLISELGDVRWYLEYLCASIYVTMDEVEAKNIQKLQERYPEGFSFEAANAERK